MGAVTADTDFGDDDFRQQLPRPHPPDLEQSLADRALTRMRHTLLTSLSLILALAGGAADLRPVAHVDDVPAARLGAPILAQAHTFCSAAPTRAPSAELTGGVVYPEVEEEEGGLGHAPALARRAAPPTLGSGREARTPARVRLRHAPARPLYLLYGVYRI